MLSLGSNPLSKIQVVSSLNIPSQANAMYYYNDEVCYENYAPKVYLGTLQTTALSWIYQYENGEKITQISDWPQNFQGSQKGEANTGKTNILNKDLFCVILY